MLRLTGLPSLARCPKVTVHRRADRFDLLFHGRGDSTLVEVAFRYLGQIEDLELTELDLLAQLQGMGYEVERRPPEDEPEG